MKFTITFFTPPDPFLFPHQCIQHTFLQSCMGAHTQNRAPSHTQEPSASFRPVSHPCSSKPRSSDKCSNQSMPSSQPWLMLLALRQRLGQRILTISNYINQRSSTFGPYGAQIMSRWGERPGRLYVYPKKTPKHLPFEVELNEDVPPPSPPSPLSTPPHPPIPT